MDRGGSISTHRHEGDAFSLVIAGDALGAGVEGQLPIDPEGVAMVAVAQFDHDQPGAVGLAAHRVGGRVPAVEIAEQADCLGLGCIADEIDTAEGLPGAGMSRRPKGTHVCHWQSRFE